MSGRPKEFYSTKICSVDGCEKRREKNGMCGMHNARIRRHGHLEPTRRIMGTGCVTAAGYIMIGADGERIYEHIRIAENALGHPLPFGAQIHHFNENPADNRPPNLVVCPTDAYHKLLHRRQKARNACGHPDWRSCCYCQQYDNPAEMAFRRNGSTAFHRICERIYNRLRYQNNRAAMS